MLFTSGNFLFLFLPITLAMFFALARIFGQQAAAIWLGLASLYFYGYWMPIYVILLIASIIGNYFMGSLMMASRFALIVSRRTILIIAIALNLSVLAYFKYANFFIETINGISGGQLALLHVVLPLGISFFTFTQIAYLADVHAGQVEERNPAHYLLFVTYFPHLIAGPVLHHSEMMPQFRRAEIYQPRFENFAVGLAFLTLGLIKKVLIADSVAPVANDLFDNARSQAISIGHTWIGVLAYTFQLYFDFSGYSDMAIGLSLLIGVQLPYNFNSPYKARNIIDFWHRWHMTLSRFLRDYLYFALGGNRRGRIRRHVNLMITMLLGGLWHGASWTFVVWGGLHGLFLMVNHGWRYLTARINLSTGAVRNSAGRWILQCFFVLLTLSCVVTAWVFFRAKTVSGALLILLSLFQQPVGARMSSGDWRLVPWSLALFALLLLAPNSQQIIDDRIRAKLPRVREHPWSRELFAFVVGIELVAIVLLALISSRRELTEFIYFNF
jgi:alginate O-acetyltransferase complex protein AlgI